MGADGTAEPDHEVRLPRPQAPVAFPLQICSPRQKDTCTSPSREINCLLEVPAARLIRDGGVGPIAGEICSARGGVTWAPSESTKKMWL